MTRRTLNAIAAALAAHDAPATLVAEIGQILADQSPNFNWQKWTEACGIRN